MKGGVCGCNEWGGGGRVKKGEANERRERVCYSYYTGLCNLQRSPFVCMVLHPCSAMDQTDRQSLIGFSFSSDICVCACVYVCVCVCKWSHTLSLSLSVSLIFHTPLLHNSCLYFPERSAQADSPRASITGLILIMKLVITIYIRSFHASLKCSEQITPPRFKLG